MESHIHEIATNYLQRAKDAQKYLVRLTQSEVDRLAYACGRVVHENAEILAQSAVDETGIGNVADKILKKRAKAEATWMEIRDKKTVGIIRRDFDKRMIYYADPVGVVAGIAPCTNPVATAMFYAMICLKTRNSLILSPHPKAVQTTALTVRLMREALRFAKLPDAVIQIIDEPQLSGSQNLALATHVMGIANMVIATGGPRLVDAAYHSGTPAYGVGAGNTPVYIHPSADIAAAVEKIISGRSFDNGIICASEQHLLVPYEIYDEVERQLSRAGAYVVSDEKAQLSEVLFEEDGHIKSRFIGHSAASIAEAAGLRAPASCRVLVVPIDASAIGQDPYSAEKLCPILSIVRTKTHTEALDIAERLLNYQVKGHSAAIHIDDKRCEADLLSFAERMPATHIIVNMPSATSSGGSKFNWLTPSTTLGCGAYGGTMPMESINLSVKQLINYKAVAMPLAESRIPEGIFA